MQQQAEEEEMVEPKPISLIKFSLKKAHRLTCIKD